MNPGSFCGKFHRHDSFDCPGGEGHQESHRPDDYVLVSLAGLPDHQGACQFDRRFAGLRDAAAVRHGRAPATVTRSDTSPAPAPTGSGFGQRVEYRVLPSGPPTSLTLVPSRQEVSIRRVVPSSPSPRRCRPPRDIVDAILPRGPVEIEIIRVDDPYTVGELHDPPCWQPEPSKQRSGPVRRPLPRCPRERFIVRLTRRRDRNEAVAPIGRLVQASRSITPTIGVPPARPPSVTARHLGPALHGPRNARGKLVRSGAPLACEWGSTTEPATVPMPTPETAGMRSLR